MSELKRCWSDYKKEDFPEKEPALKWKKGLWYREKNSGYTDDIMKAGLYDRNETIQYCFSGEKNGKCEVIAVPIRAAMKEQFMDKRKIKKYRERLDIFEKYAEEKGDDYVVF